MVKLIGLSDYIRFRAALISGEVLKTQDLSGIFPLMKIRKQDFKKVGYINGSYSTIVSKLISDNEISRELDDNGNVYLKLHPKGKRKLFKKYPLAFKRCSKWNGDFMIVVFDIAEFQRRGRDKLRRKLKELGFGMMQRSVWISPYHFENELSEYVDSINLKNDVFVFCSKCLWAGKLKRFAYNVWGLEEVASGYKDIINKYKLLNKKQVGDSKESKKKIVNLYFKVLLKDPLLPDRCLPDDWPQKEALRCVNNV